MDEPTCSLVEDGKVCGQPVRVKKYGWCSKHWKRWTKRGDPLAPDRRRVKRDLEARFLEKVDKSGPIPARCPELGSCWIWTAGKNQPGYGRFYWDGKIGQAHRFAYSYFVAEVPDDLEVRHRCDNPPCVNPAHLLLGTHLENMQDMVERDRQWRKDWKRCDRGHDLTLPGAVLHQSFADRCRECCRERSYQNRVRERGGPPRQLKLSMARPGVAHGQDRSALDGDPRLRL